jgi:hypothetical protein
VPHRVFACCQTPGNRPKNARSAETLGRDIRMERRDERELREELVKLRAEHRRLDGEIASLEGNPSADQLLVKRLKKKKLALKDRITQIEDKLLPDIIA